MQLNLLAFSWTEPTCEISAWGERLSCCQCEYKATQASNLTIHKQVKYMKSKLHCVKCDYNCIRPSGLKKHMLTVHEDIRYSCDKYADVTTRPEHLTKHKRTKYNFWVFACDLCDYKFNLYQHTRLHQQIRLECDFKSLHYNSFR